jgi:hypothetical protein
MLKKIIFFEARQLPNSIPVEMNYTVFVSYPSQGGQRNKNKQKTKEREGREACLSEPNFKARKFNEQPHTLGFLGRSYQT